MPIDPSSFQKYMQSLSYKLVQYLGPDFDSRYAKMDTGEKIRFVIRLQTDIENTHISEILKSGSEIKDPIFEVMRDIYNFLYTDNNTFSKKSYLRLLNEMKDIEGKGENTDLLKEKLNDLENAIISKIKYDLKNLQSRVINKDIKEKSLLLMRVHGAFIGVGISLLLAAALMYYSCTNSNTSRVNEKTSEFPLTEWADRQNTPNPMINAAEFLKLADTCSAWALIKSLDTVTIRTKTFIEDIRPSGYDTDTLQRFNLLCDMAVNYTISEYSKISKIPIKNIPDSLPIMFYEHNDSLISYYIRFYDKIYVNNYDLGFNSGGYSDGAKTFLLFAAISHETVHMINGFNNPYTKKIDDFQVKFDNLKKEGKMIDVKEVDEYIRLRKEYDKFSEVEAIRFGHELFFKLFNGILEDNRKSIVFAQSYYRSVLLKQMRKKGDYNAIYMEIFDALNKVRLLLPALQTQIDAIYTYRYDGLDAQYSKIRKELLH